MLDDGICDGQSQQNKLKRPRMEGPSTDNSFEQNSEEDEAGIQSTLDHLLQVGTDPSTVIEEVETDEPVMVSKQFLDNLLMAVNTLTDRVSELTISVDNMQKQMVAPKPVNPAPINTSVKTKNVRDTDEVWSLKNKVVDKWGKHFFERKKAFGKSYVNFYKSHILDGQVNSNPPYIPPKFRYNHARNLEHFKVLEERSKSNMRSASKEFHLNGTEAKAKFLAIDDKMIETIERHHIESERKLLLDLWKRETKEAEAACTIRSDNTWQWLTSLPETKPYYGYQQEPDQITVPTAHHNTQTHHNQIPVRNQQSPECNSDQQGPWQGNRGRGQKQNRGWGRGKPPVNNRGTMHRNPQYSRGGYQTQSNSTNNFHGHGGNNGYPSLHNSYGVLSEGGGYPDSYRQQASGGSGRRGQGRTHNQRRGNF